MNAPSPRKSFVSIAIVGAAGVVVVDHVRQSFCGGRLEGVQVDQCHGNIVSPFGAACFERQEGPDS